jgi:hypothetical protein
MCTHILNLPVPNENFNLLYWRKKISFQLKSLARSHSAMPKSLQQRAHIGDILRVGFVYFMLIISQSNWNVMLLFL